MAPPSAAAGGLPEKTPRPSPSTPTPQSRPAARAIAESRSTIEPRPGGLRFVARAPGPRAEEYIRRWTPASAVARRGRARRVPTWTCGRSHDGSTRLDSSEWRSRSPDHGLQEALPRRSRCCSSDHVGRVVPPTVHGRRHRRLNPPLVVVCCVQVGGMDQAAQQECGEWAALGVGVLPDLRSAPQFRPALMHFGSYQQTPAPPGRDRRPKVAATSPTESRERSWPRRSSWNKPL